MEEQIKKGISRREFLRDAGLVVGTTAIGSLALSGACKGTSQTQTLTQTKTVTVTAAPPASAGLAAFTVNGQAYQIPLIPNLTLADFLRDNLELTGTKISCNEGACGACTVSIDGKPRLACMTLAVDCNGTKIETIESFTSNRRGQDVLDAFMAQGAVQCGFCSPGMVMATKLMLDEVAKPTENDVRTWLAGNICRCGTHNQVIAAALALAGGE